MEIGVGPEKTKRALDWLASRWEVPKLVIPGLSSIPLTSSLRFSQRPPFLVMAGFAGALSSALRVGDIFLASDVVDMDGNVVDMDGNRWPMTSPHNPSNDHVRHGRLLTSPRMIGDPAEKRRLHEAHAAQAVDMEAATVARFCHEHGVPFGCVRAISDNVDTALSPHLVSLLGTGQVSISRLLATLVRHPTVIASLLKLARDTRLAALALSAALARMLFDDKEPYAK